MWCLFAGGCRLGALLLAFLELHLNLPNSPPVPPPPPTGLSSSNCSFDAFSLLLALLLVGVPNGDERGSPPPLGVDDLPLRTWSRLSPLLLPDVAEAAATLGTSR